MTRVVVHGESAGSPPCTSASRGDNKTTVSKMLIKVCSRTRARGRTTDRRHRQRDVLRLTRCHQHYGGELGSSTNNNEIIIRARAPHCLDSLIAVSLGLSRSRFMKFLEWKSCTRNSNYWTQNLKSWTRNSILDDKQSSIVYKCPHGLEHSSTLQGRGQLRSGTTGILHIPRTKTTIRSRSFAVTGSVTWNSLPVELRTLD